MKNKKLKKIKTVKPFIRSTIKQNKLIKNIVETCGSENGTTLNKLMVKSGYSINSAINPLQIIQGKGFQALMEQAGITDQMLVSVGVEGLRAERMSEDGELVPDWNNRHKFWKDCLDLKGHIKHRSDNADASGEVNESRTRQISLMIKETFKK